MKVIIFLLVITTTTVLGQNSFISESNSENSNFSPNVEKIALRSTVAKAIKVNVDFEALKSSKIDIKAMGNSISAIGSISELRKSTDFTWKGKNDAGELFVFTVSDSIINGMFYQGKVMYRLTTIKKDYILYEVNQKEFPVEKCDFTDANLKQGRQSSSNGLTSSSLDCNVRVLFVFTQDAIDILGSETISNFAQSCVDVTNACYLGSSITPRLEVAYVYETNYTENSSNMSQSLYDFTNTTDGNMDEVHVLRNQYAVDLCVLIGDYGDYCGIAWLYANYNYSFSVNHVECAIDNLTFPHEIGHNFGAYHDPYVTSGNSKPYGYGYINLVERWRTIMAYNNQCNANGFYCSRIPYFSNPDISYFGNPTGTVAQNNNARVHNETYSNIISITQPTNSLTLAMPDSVGVFGHAISKEFINSSGPFTISTDDRYIFNAGRSIELSPGFMATDGGVFMAEIKTISNCGIADKKEINLANK